MINCLECETPFINLKGANILIFFHLVKLFENDFLETATWKFKGLEINAFQP